MRSGYNAYKVSALPCILIEKAHTQIYPIPWKGPARCNLRDVSNLLPEECEYPKRQSRPARAYRHSGNRSTAPVEKENASFHCGRYSMLYAPCAAGILSLPLLHVWRLHINY